MSIKPSGCTQCIIQQPTICCELCLPSYFETVAHVSLEKSKNRPPCSTLPEKNYKTNPCDIELWNALHDFHKTHTLEHFGCAHLCNTGPGVIMANDVLQHIVDCAHISTSLKQLPSLWRRLTGAVQRSLEMWYWILLSYATLSQLQTHPLHLLPMVHYPHPFLWSNPIDARLVNKKVISVSKFIGYNYTKLRM